MRLLLDTHVWLWFLLGSKDLKASHRKLIESENADVWLSPISIWEAMLLIERGRLPVSGEAQEWIATALATMPLREASLSFEIAHRSRQIRVQTSDSADRFIAASAAVLDLTLITYDKNLLSCPDIRLG